MKERPILFSAPMVRAILAGTKTQTRRVVKPQPEAEHGGEPYWFVGGYRAWTYRNTTDLLRKGGNVLPCPYGQPGDRLWVREAWQAELRWDWTAPRDIKRGSPIYFEFGDEAVPACAGKKRPSIHMPRWASRITLEVTAVRVERLHDISADDARAEGCPDKPVPGAEQASVDLLAKLWFHDLWAQINGQASWDANPWVWVVEFKRIEGAPA